MAVEYEWVWMNQAGSVASRSAQLKGDEKARAIRERWYRSYVPKLPVVPATPAPTAKPASAPPPVAETPPSKAGSDIEDEAEADDEVPDKAVVDARSRR